MKITNPNLERLKQSHVDQALLKRGLDLADPIRLELLARAEVLQGYRGEPVVRVIDDTRTLVPADIFLDQSLNRRPNYVPPKSDVAGPIRIPTSDKCALLSVDPVKVSEGKIVIFDDRLPR